MAEDGSLTIDCRNLHELRVIDLKKELEKRGLSKSGSKKELVDRLKTQLKIEELREKSRTVTEGVQVPSIQLLEGGQNEFVKSYLQQREKLFEQQMEQKKKYEEEASRSQESESQSETDDGAKPDKMCSGETEVLLPLAAKLSREGAEKAVTSREDTELIHSDRTEKAEDDIIIIDVKGDDATVELPTRSRSRSGSSRSRSSSSTTSPSRERSQSGSRASRSRSPSLEEGVQCSGSPVRPEESSRENQPNSSADTSSKKVQRSRSNSSSGLPPLAEGQKGEKKADTKLRSRDGERQNSDSESSDRSSPVRKNLRSSSVSSDSSASPEIILPHEETTKKPLKGRPESLSGSSTDVEDVDQQQGSALHEKPSPSKEYEERKTALEEEKPVPVVASDSITIVLDADADDDSHDTLTPESGNPLFQKVKDQKNNDKAQLEVENIQKTLKDHSTLSVHQSENDFQESKAEEGEIRPTRKRRWGSTTLKTITSQPSTNISTESLKALIPEMKVDVQIDLLPELEDPSPEEHNHKDLQLMDVTESAEEDKEKENLDDQRDPVAAKRKVLHKGQELAKQKSQDPAKLSRTIFQAVKPGDENNDHEMEKAVEEVVTLQALDESDTLNDSVEKKIVDENKRSILEEKKIETRRISRPQVPLIPVDDPQPVGRRSPSPARNSATNIVHIHRLVRPYTLGQLKELLSQAGKMVDEGFWIDKIKSHCLVVYNTVDEAVAARRLLHGKRWPLSNPNILRVEYSTQEEFDMFKNAKDGVVPPKPSLRPEEVPELKQEEKAKPAEQVKEHKRKEPVKLSTRDGRPKAKERSPPIREWDRDKIKQSRSRSRDRNRRDEKVADRGARAGRGNAHEKDQNRDKAREERRKRRASSPEHKEKKDKVEAEPPAKLLDDLFRKTKAVPCIYWLPLTEEQIAQKLVAQQQAEAEREQRRMEREQQQQQQQQICEGQRGAKEERVPKETRREDRHLDRRERASDGRQMDPSESKMAAVASGNRGDRITSRR